MDSTRMEPMTDQEVTEEAVAGSPEERPPEPAERRDRRRWAWVAAVIAALALGGALVAALLANGNGDSGAETTLNTATVRRSDLVATTTLDGVLGYGEGEQIVFRSSDDGVDTLPGGLSGVVTAEPVVGAYYEQGSVLYEVNSEPVVVLYGDRPAYRTLSTRADDGEDILQLEEGLAALGYNGFTVDDEFTSATRDAVEEFQEDIGAEPDGVLDLGEYVFVPGPLYVADSFVGLAQTTQSGSPVVASSAVMGTTVTWVPEEGAIIDQGGVLYAVDSRPVVLMLGDVPAYRALTVGDTGPDVEQLEQALTDLGYAEDAGLAVDGVFDGQTRAAVILWQADIGAHTDGVVNLGEVVFRGEPIRVVNRSAMPGDGVQNGAPIFESSASFTFVTVELPTDDQDLVAVGDGVAVELPDGEVVTATVTEIGSVAQVGQGGGSFFEMTVTLDDPEAAPGLDEAPVDVEVVSDSASDVLAVPVTALLALAEGGYAVEVVNEDGTTFLIGVEPGLFADGRVEVVGEGLADGMLVAVP